MRSNHQIVQMAQNITKNAVNSDLQNSYDILLKLKNLAEIDNKICNLITYIGISMIIKIQEFESMPSLRKLHKRNKFWAFLSFNLVIGQKYCEENI